MQVRLGFAVAVHTDPEVLLIDEVLAVGDLVFQRKCLDRIAEFKARGCTIVLVSHDTHAIQQLCDTALWLQQGKLMAHGPAELVAGQYVAEMSAETRRRTPVQQPILHTSTGTALRINENRFGSLEVEITAVRLCAPSGFLAAELNSGDPLKIEIDYLARNPVPAPIFGVTWLRDDGTVCYDTSTEAAGITISTLQGRGRITLHVDRLDLIGGQYYVDVGVYEKEWTYAYDYHWHVYPLRIFPTQGEKGIVRPPHHWEIPAVTATADEHS
jgi:lipopolysaccharide transport system ATP-binding protein